MPKEATRVDAAGVLERLTATPEGDDTDARVLRAAAELLAGGGLARFEVDVVASRSGVARSTVYRRFGDRNQLIAATLAHEGRRLLTVLADAVVGVDDPVEQLAVAFCAGLRVARAGGLVELVRSDPLVLRLLTVDSAPVVAAAAEQLTALALHRFPALDETEVVRTAELLVRLALSFVVNPESALDVEGEGAEDAVRRHLAPLIRTAG